MIRLLAVFLVLILSSCGHMKGKSGLFATKSEGGLLNTEAKSPNEAAATDPNSFKNVVHQNPEIMGVKLTNTNFDIPVNYNQEVLSWLEYFTGPGRKHFSIYMQRMARVEPLIIPKLKKSGLPEDLIYLAMIESGFSTAAKSHAGAVGPWQFIKSTGRLFGLRADWWVDERRDPVRATDAAIEYLSRLYAEFGDWRLACAAYNSGEIKIRNAIARLGTRDFWSIAKDRKALRRETKDYVPKMMAAAIIGKNAEVFGFQKYPADTFHVDTEEVKIPRTENLRNIAKIANVDRETLTELNPHLLRCCTPPQRGEYVIRVPKGEPAKNLIAAIESRELGRYAGFRRHVIRRGDNLSKIASQNGIPVESILAMNDIQSVKGLKPGSEILVPEGGGAGPSRGIASEKPKKKEEGTNSIEVANAVVDAAVSAGQQMLTYVVQKGDTLTSISHRYAVRISEIRRWNSLDRSKTLRPGSKLTLYVSNEKSQNI